MDTLADGVAVVTGAASGIGLALARRFAGESMSVVMADVEEGALPRVRRLRARPRSPATSRRCGATCPTPPRSRRSPRGRSSASVACTSCATTPASSRSGRRGSSPPTTGAGCSTSTCGASCTACAPSCRSCCARACPATSSTRRRSPGSCRHRRSRPTTPPRLVSSPSPRRSTWSCARSARRSGCRCCAPASCRRASPRAGATDRAPTAVRNRCSTCPRSTTSHRPR